MHRGSSRNVEGGVLILCRAVGSNFVLGLAVRKAACIDLPSLFSRLDWLSYHLCALHALLPGRLSLSDVATRTGHTMGTPHCHCYAVSPPSPCWVNRPRVY